MPIQHQSDSAQHLSYLRSSIASPPNMESEETSENFPGKKLEMNTVDDVDDHALAPALGGAAGQLTALDNSGLEGVSATEHNLERSENSVGNGGLLPVDHHCPPTGGVGKELLVDLPVPVNGADVRSGEEKGGGDSDLQLEEGEAGDGESDDDDNDDDEVEYDDEDMFFDQHFDPVPPERLHRNDSMKEPMVPYGSKDAEQALQHFVQVFEERYGKEHPHFFIGSLENAMKEVFSNIEDPDQLKPLLIYIHSDHSIMAHVFCSKVLCSQPIIDYLNRNYITWPWDITQPENKETLLSMVEDCFSEEPPDDDGQTTVHRGMHFQKQDWRSFRQQGSEFQPRPEGQWAEHVPAKAVLQQLVTGNSKDDLPACLISYPISNEHSIQGTWLAGKGSGDIAESFLEVLVSSVEDYKILLQQSKHLKQVHDTSRLNRNVQYQAPPTGPSHQVPQLDWEFLRNVQVPAQHFPVQLERWDEDGLFESQRESTKEEQDRPASR